MLCQPSNRRGAAGKRRAGRGGDAAHPQRQARPADPCLCRRSLLRKHAQRLSGRRTRRALSARHHQRGDRRDAGEGAGSGPPHQSGRDTADFSGHGGRHAARPLSGEAAPRGQSAAVLYEWKPGPSAVGENSSEQYADPLAAQCHLGVGSGVRTEQLLPVFYGGGRAAAGRDSRAGLHQSGGLSEDARRPAGEALCAPEGSELSVRGG